MAKSPDGPKFIEIDGEEYETNVVQLGNKTYTIRELSADEDDESVEAARDDKGIVNGRLSQRIAIQRAIVEPPTTIEQIGKWPVRRYVLMARAFNQLNIAGDDGSGNASAPGTSNEPT